MIGDTWNSGPNKNFEFLIKQKFKIPFGTWKEECRLAFFKLEYCNREEQR